MDIWLAGSPEKTRGVPNEAPPTYGNDLDPNNGSYDKWGKSQSFTEYYMPNFV